MTAKFLLQLWQTMRILKDIVVLPEGVMKPRERLTGSMDFYSSMQIGMVDLHVMAIRLTYADSGRCLDRYSTPIYE